MMIPPRAAFCAAISDGDELLRAPVRGLGLFAEGEEHSCERSCGTHDPRHESLQYFHRSFPFDFMTTHSSIVTVVSGREYWQRR